MIGVTEDALRGWLARNPEPAFIGNRYGRRVYLSCKDAFYYLVVAELAEFGVNVRVAMYNAARLTPADSLPRHDYLFVRKKAPGIAEFELTDDPRIDDQPALILPLKALANVLIEDAARVYAREEQ